MLDDASVTLATMPRTYDEVYNGTCTINTVTGAGPYTITIAAGSEWTPTVGDLVIQSGVSYEVTGVTSTTVFAVDTAGLVAAAASWREGYPIRVVWTARAEGNVGAEKHWRSLSLPYELTTMIATLKSYFAGYRNTAAPIEANVNLDTSNGASPWAMIPAYKRVAVPTAFGRDWAIKVGFSLTRAGAWFSTSGVSVLYENVQPDKVSR